MTSDEQQADVELTPEERARLRKRRVRNLRNNASVMGAVGFALTAVASAINIYPAQIIGSALIAASGACVAAATILESRQTDTAIEEIESEIESREAPAKPEETVVDSLRRYIGIAVNREEISMLLAERRANTLYAVGQFFLIASVLAPIGAAVIYWNIDPLPVETVQQLKDLKETLGGDLPKDISVSVQRDWRVLLGGVSFGFLLLAAAAGLLRQQRKEIAIFFRQAERVNRFARLDDVLQIRSQHPADESVNDASLIELVVDRLLEDSDKDNEDPDDDPEPDPTAAVNLAKAIRGIST